MAEIAPFRGILYDTSKVDASSVLAPPYDVIDADARQRFADRDPKNCVRLILPEGDGDAKYANAAGVLDSWLEDGTLVRDARPAVYRYHQVFTNAELGDRTVVRKGFIASVRLRKFDEGVILPHERTLKGPKIDRLKLMSATGAHFSQIFTFYSDPSRRTDQLFRRVEGTAPDLEATTDDGTRHLLWRVADRELIGELTHLMAPLKLYIADGHHRYETMLALRSRMREAAGGELAWKSAGEYGTLFLSNMDDDGLIVLPTHRLLHGVADFDAAKVLEAAGQYFDSSRLSGAVGDAAGLRASIADATSSGASFAVVLPGASDATLLTLKPSVDLAEVGICGSRAITELDVTVLHDLLLDKVIGIDRAAQEANTHLKYIKDTGKALARIASGEGQMCFIMNATELRQVRAVADAGEFMPQKSTFFYPKIASGVVFTPVNPDEDLG